MSTERKIGRPTKTDDEKRSTYLRVRLTQAQERTIKDAAEHAGISVSAWAVERLLRCARNELK
jgi:uncharacterized protein (DUF1778 family)